MFERYTEASRRCVFFARHQAAQSGSRYIEPHHLLIAIVTEDRELALRILKNESLEDLSRQLMQEGSQPISPAADLPLSQASKRILVYGAEEAERERSQAIRPRHLLTGLLREESPAQRALVERGITLELCRTELQGAAGEPGLDAWMGLREVPQLRMAAAARILQALSSPQVTVEVKTPEESFTISFGEEEEQG